MVKVKSCLSLCPIPDPKSFLGLSKDFLPESLIVTLGRNLVLRTKTTDLQQLTSWNIRDHLTAPVVYDNYDNRYIGIFNHSFIKYWSENELNYEKAKKYKFTSKLHSVLTQDDSESIIVFSNGPFKFHSDTQFFEFMFLHFPSSPDYHDNSMLLWSLTWDHWIFNY
ncbi:nucleolar protein 11-like [Diaphorina citri]|uniref:Nucleolar protein 11-like n=1 Tax=Diaphorina citri TaxID=121845 RepID=A0A3Q0IYQ5_DIACI|nr:nucleolar protein 11-like [Diaphorina citri]